jgi:hypothetical protein
MQKMNEYPRSWPQGTPLPQNRDEYDNGLVDCYQLIGVDHDGHIYDSVTDPDLFPMFIILVRHSLLRIGRLYVTDGYYAWTIGKRKRVAIATVDPTLHYELPPCQAVRKAIAGSLESK